MRCNCMTGEIVVYNQIIAQKTPNLEPVADLAKELAIYSGKWVLGVTNLESAGQAISPVATLAIEGVPVDQNAAPGYVTRATTVITESSIAAAKLAVIAGTTAGAVSKAFSAVGLAPEADILSQRGVAEATFNVVTTGVGVGIQALGTAITYVPTVIITGGQMLYEAVTQHTATTFKTVAFVTLVCSGYRDLVPPPVTKSIITASSVKPIITTSQSQLPSLAGACKGIGKIILGTTILVSDFSALVGMK